MIKKGLSVLGIFFLYLVSLLPFWFLYVIADILFVLLYYVVGYRRKVVQQNLANSFPEKTPGERKDIEKKYFRYLCELIMETIKMMSISREEVKRRMESINEAAIYKYMAEGRNVIGAAGHYGNWELAALRFSVLSECQRIIVYKPLTNPTFDNYFKKMRSRFGATVVAMKQTMRKFVEYRNEVVLSVLVADQTPAWEEVNYFTDFLNQPTAVFLGIEKLANATNAVVVFCDVRRVKRGYYNFRFITLTEDPKHMAPYEITNAHVKYLENMIRSKPEYWLWSHRRWKHKPEDIKK
jgi:KDO2-lipid IV(A) lauroyltransferase